MLLTYNENCKRGVKNTATLRCDVCLNEFQRPYHKVKHQTIHCCSKQCMTTSLRDDGLLAQKRKQTNIERLGVEHPLQSSFVKDKASLTRSLWSPEQKAEIERKKTQTFLENWGVKHPMRVSSVMEKRKRTSIELYGTSFPFERDEIRKKAETTNLERYGVVVPVQSPLIREKVDKKRQKQREIETKKRNNSFNTSKPENKLALVLYEIFGQTNVERQILMNDRWPIDFRVTLNDGRHVYIQYDSLYWHGLDRPREVIEQRRTKQDCQILVKMDIDARQNQWFVENNLTLIRTSLRLSEIDKFTILDLLSQYLRT